MVTFEEFKGNRNWTHERPRDPECADVEWIEIQIVHASGKISVDPNAGVLYSHGITPREIMSKHGNWRIDCTDETTIDGKLTDLLPVPGLVSVISGEPALLYRTNEAQIPLTNEEIVRLEQQTLSPQEFTAICDAVGAIWQLHDDFYNPDTGESWRLMEQQDETAEAGDAPAPK